VLYLPGGGGGGKNGFLHNGFNDDLPRGGGSGGAEDDGFQGFTIAGAAGDVLSFKFDQTHACVVDPDIQLCFWLHIFKCFVWLVVLPFVVLSFLAKFDHKRNTRKKKVAPFSDF